jgi:polyphosphate kinase
VTRSAELELDEQGTDDLLDVVARATSGRGYGAAVRLEVERSMPPILRALLLEDLRREQPSAEFPFVTDVEEVDGLLDLAALAELDLRMTRRSAFRAFRRRNRSRMSIRCSMRSPSAMCSSTTRSIRSMRPSRASCARRPPTERARDQDHVVSHRQSVADRRRVARCRKAWKSVTVFVELKARFDETMNVKWARALEAAGGHVVRGLVDTRRTRRSR